MHAAFIILVGFLLLLALLAIVSEIGARIISRRYPSVGAFTNVGGARIHHVHVRARPQADLPPIVFIHGASANLKDQMLPLRPLLDGRATLLFFDRPGHGWSERGGDASINGQAAMLAALMDKLEIPRAIIVGHSFGGAIAAAFALNHPEKVAGLIFLSAATHAWTGGQTSWYYRVTAMPVLGWLFARAIALPAGWARVKAGAASVFAPNSMPDNYVDAASIPLVLRPATFRNNAIDVEALYPFALANQQRYAEIAAPTIIVSGDSDTVVFEKIHSLGLARDIPGAELVWIEGLGHKPDWLAPDLVVAAVEKLAGKHCDVQALGKAVERRLALRLAASSADADMPLGGPTASTT